MSDNTRLHPESMSERASMPQVDPFKVRILQGSELHLEYRLRYEVMADEGKAEYLDHDERIWVDALDRPGSLHFGAFDLNGTIIGTQRLCFHRDGPFLVDEAYQWRALASLVGLPLHDLSMRTALLDRGCVVESWRRRGVKSKLIAMALSHATLQGACCVVGAVAKGNDRSMLVLERNGFRNYGGLDGQPGHECLHFVHSLKPEGRP